MTALRRTAAVRARRTAAVLGVLALAPAGVTAGAGPAAASGTAPAPAQVTLSCDPQEDPEEPSAVAGFPSESLDVPRVQQWVARHRPDAPQAGSGVTVAVLDSGVAAPVPLAGQETLVPTTRPGANYYHGTAVAGIIAGPASGGRPIGIAPGARVYDLKIYDGIGPDSPETDTQVTSTGIYNGLARVLELRATTQPAIRVVNLSVAIPADDPGIKSLVNRLWDAGVVVVASAGNRPPADTEDPALEPYATPSPGEDAARVVYPAGYDRVVAATTTAGGLPEDTAPTDFVMASSQTDVAVPTSGVLSYSTSGQPCILRRPATSWAAAEVSGVMAVLASIHPDDDPAQLVARLELTAAGRSDVRSMLTGAGVAQPYAALTQPLDLTRGGELKGTRPVLAQDRAEAPVAEVDPLGDTRRDVVWYGVVGGGVLVLALVLRPVLARRRRD